MVNNENIDPKQLLNIKNAIGIIIENENQPIVEENEYYLVETQNVLPITKLFNNISEGIDKIVEVDSGYRIYKKKNGLNESEENKPKDTKKFVVYEMDEENGNLNKLDLSEKKKKKNNKPPRYWSNKFWSKNKVDDIIKEIVEPKNVETGKLELKDTLNPNIFDENDQMHPDVRNTLLKNAIEFIKFSKIDKIKYSDIIVTGSLANYNWHDDSDIDVHILLNFDQISEDKEFVSDYFKTKKDFWGEKYDNEVKGYEVEMYIQDTEEPHSSTGVYSLIKNQWVTKPIKKMLSIDVPDLQLKAADLMNRIEDLEGNVNMVSSINEIDKLITKIKKYRKIGLDREGEYSTENLVFKIIRNNGYLEKLFKLKDEIFAKELTLENVSMYDAQINENGIIDTVQNIVRNNDMNVGLVVGFITRGIDPNELLNAGVDKELINKGLHFVKRYPDIMKRSN